MAPATPCPPRPELKVVRFENVGLRYGLGPEILRDLNFSIPANSFQFLTGPSGAGKELVARIIHEQSARAAGPFVALNSATITPERMEIELFGVEQTNGEQPRKAGALEEAHGGTLYLDEVADMPRETQGKILRVLVDQNFQRVTLANNSPF